MYDLPKISPEEYKKHLHRCFKDEHFRGEDEFIFSKSALVRGLSSVEKRGFEIECLLEESGVSVGEINDLLEVENLSFVSAKMATTLAAIVIYSRELSVVANMLKFSLNDISFIEENSSSRENKDDRNKEANTRREHHPIKRGD